ncbi:putative nuclease HARBI1 [Cucumis melo var. makuwa]|uniref:Nuclease HARBI1 n=1 Tax=Cucumis melo var. makuwa TaxID=1194695 RepID=A0A5D3CTT8_CUCMM|nr:putative nuclease HARBI1 [Cucumis melo var. makuwa]TYK15357.1 putative nuclease HARBI1 [Cucumis melo var. makuwa]
MDRRCFGILYHLLRTIARLTSTKVVDVEEMIAMFLHILAHDMKNRVIQRHFMRSGETIFRHFNMVLLAIIRLHDELLKKPQPVPNNCTDQRWRWFENCLDALDGTYIKVNVPAGDRPSIATTLRLPKHSCIKEEETWMVECLVELVNVGGWRSDNGTFRAGYLNQLARMMAYKSHLATKGLLNRSFPHYDKLSYVFGKDRATGGRAETFEDVRSNDPTGYATFRTDAVSDMEFQPMYSQ